MPAGNLRRLDLNLLVALDALLRTRNVTKAGQELMLTQSAMSGELRRLRRMFGDELLVRVGREYELTPLARDLIEPVADILAKIERTVGYRISFDPAVDSRHFSLVMSDYAMLLVLQPLLRRTLTEAPGITVDVHPINDQIPKMLGSGGADLVIGPAVDVPGFQSQLLFTDRSVCIVAADNPEVDEKLTAELFQTLPHLTVTPQHPLLPWTTDADVEAWGVRRHVGVSTNNFALAPFLISGTQLAALVPERLANLFRETAGIRVLEPPFAGFDLHETMYWSPVADSDPAHAWLRRSLSEIARAMT